MSETTNYHFPLYDSEDKPNLRDQYNGAINMIDTKFLQTDGSINEINQSVSDANESIENINTALKGKAPTMHAVGAGTYGLGTDKVYGHLKVVDSGSAAASTATAASPLLVQNAVSKATAPKKLLTIGDSYSRMEDASQVSWPTYLKNYCGYSEFTNYGEGGAGFVTPGISGHTFPQLAEQAISNITDKADYGMVVVAGGRNDSMTTEYTTYYNAVYNMLTRLKTSFPNARIMVVPMLWHNIRSYSRGLWTLAGATIDAASSCGCEGVNWAWTWGLSRDSLYDGGIHPLSAGGQMIAAYIASAINGSYTGRILTAKISDFGSGDATIIGNGGTMTVLVGGTYNNQDADNIPNAFKCNTLGSCWSYIYAGGGSSGCVLQLGKGMAIYGGGNKGNIGGMFAMPW